MVCDLEDCNFTVIFQIKSIFKESLILKTFTSNFIIDIMV